jgi:hypothetical protein
VSGEGSEVVGGAGLEIFCWVASGGVRCKAECGANQWGKEGEDVSIENG